MLAKGCKLEGLEDWVFNQTHLGVIIADASLNITFLSRWFEDFLQVKSSEVCGAGLFDVFPTLRGNSTEKAIASALNGQATVLSNRFHKFIIPIKLSKSEYHGIEFMQQTTTFSPRKTGDKHDGLVIVIENVTDRVAHELELSKQLSELKSLHQSLENYTGELQKTNAEKDKFFSIIAHDLRSPFNVFLGISEYLAENINSISEHERQDLTASLNKSAQSTFALLENLLEWSRLKRGLIVLNPENIKLHQLSALVMNSLNEMANRKQITLISDMSSDLGVMADLQMLRTIIHNLLTNAIKFTPEGGTVSLIAIYENDSHVRISVHDSGIGMKKELLDDLFKINAKVGRPGTNKEPSSGLGLLLCKEFVEKHGGKIWAESEPGKGSVFSFTLKNQ